LRIYQRTVQNLINSRDGCREYEAEHAHAAALEYQLQYFQAPTYTIQQARHKLQQQQQEGQQQLDMLNSLAQAINKGVLQKVPLLLTYLIDMAHSLLLKRSANFCWSCAT
jgi:hypothetical protein